MLQGARRTHESGAAQRWGKCRGLALPLHGATHTTPPHAQGCWEPRRRLHRASTCNPSPLLAVLALHSDEAFAPFTSFAPDGPIP